MAKVAILLGSPNDEKYILDSFQYFEYFGIEKEVHFLSAHRNPAEVGEFAKNARKNGFCALIGGAGMAAHLAGALAAHSDLPILGTPMANNTSDGMDALLSTVQMPKGVPVATFAIGKAGVINAAIFVAQMISVTDENMAKKLAEFKYNGCKI